MNWVELTARRGRVQSIMFSVWQNHACGQADWSYDVVGEQGFVSIRGGDIAWDTAGPPGYTPFRLSGSPFTELVDWSKVWSITVYQQLTDGTRRFQHVANLVTDIWYNIPHISTITSRRGRPSRTIINPRGPQWSFLVSQNACNRRIGAANLADIVMVELHQADCPSSPMERWKQGGRPDSMSSEWGITRRYISQADELSNSWFEFWCEKFTAESTQD